MWSTGVTQPSGKAIGTFRKLADLIIITARVDSLEPWYDSSHGEEPGSRKEEMHMGIYKVKDRRGRRRFVVSKYWP
ncbi:MAG: hypothetical protein OXT71_14670, partial [Acidobacteriota bacterium]|nr:hypothetical protein [Acidobacteriota bacterium]